jgi:lipooligosaccharide transport system permease protein
MNKAMLYPSWSSRIYSVWYRHYKVYTKNFFSNGFPPFFETTFFLFAFGLGLGSYISPIDGLSYLQFMASAIPVTAAMFTAAFESSIGTYVRLEYEKVYDGMLSGSITADDLIIGEILFCGTKGFFFSASVLIVIAVAGLISAPSALLVPVVGFLTGIMFSALSLWVTSFVKNINHFNFYLSGVLTPLFFFSGIFFPLEQFPPFIQLFCRWLPLTQVAILCRACSLNQWNWSLLLNLLYCLVFISLFTRISLVQLRKRLID